MTSFLKKLEASEGADAASYDLSRLAKALRADRIEEERPHSDSQAESQVYAVPENGWLGGPGRWHQRRSA